MFNVLADKIIFGVVSAGMILFSSFQGNKATFTSPEFVANQNRFYISTTLENAFENDFEDIIRSGEEIFIDFEIKLEKNSSVSKSIIFSHSIIYNAMDHSYTLKLEEHESEQHIFEYSDLLHRLSIIDYSFEEYVQEVNTITLTASIRNVNLPSLNKQYDMMMLWNFRKPKIVLNVTDYKNEN